MDDNLSDLVHNLTVELFKLINGSLNSSFISSFGGSNSSDLIKIQIRKKVVLLNDTFYNKKYKEALNIINELYALIMTEISLNKITKDKADQLINQLDHISKIITKEIN